MQNHNSKNKSDLKHRCYRFSLALISFIGTLPGNPVLRTIVNQLIRSGTSVGANLVEASSASSKLEFKKYHEIALKSANETKYWLCLLRDSQKVGHEQVNKLLDEVVEISNMIAAGVLKLKGKTRF